MKWQKFCKLYVCFIGSIKITKTQYFKLMNIENTQEVNKNNKNKSIYFVINEYGI